MRSTQFSDGSAGDADYGEVGIAYARYRQPDPSIAHHIRAAIGDAHTVLNVGAGAGSYEPRDRELIAVEPSAMMRAQRPPDLPDAIDAVAEHLPFADRSFDATMAISTVHQWPDLPAGLGELVRVTRGPIVILTSDPAALQRYWLADYLPELLEIQARRFPTIDTIASLLGGTDIRDVPIPLTCTDGFEEAYYGSSACRQRAYRCARLGQQTADPTSPLPCLAPDWETSVAAWHSSLGRAAGVAEWP
jgi:SAM-dependent methyltransferase